MVMGVLWTTLGAAWLAKPYRYRRACNQLGIEGQTCRIRLGKRIVDSLYRLALAGDELKCLYIICQLAVIKFRSVK